MKINETKLINDFHRDTFWTKVHMKSDSGKETNIYICASFEYLWDFFKTKDFNESQLKEWLSSVVIPKWTLRGEAIFKESVNYDVYATTQEGKKNGLEFLMELKTHN